MHLICHGLVIATSLAVVGLRAQTLVPRLTRPLPSVSLLPGGAAATVDIRNHITVPDVIGTQFARFDTVLGQFSVELRNDAAPRNVANFLSYAASGAYNSSFIHRSATFVSSATSIIQGGGYRVPFPVTAIPKQPPVPLEFNLSHLRGTLGAARGLDINSATSEWFFNVRDNSSVLNLGPLDNAYTVFGRVLGTGMSVVDAIAAIPRFNAGGPFTELPLQNYTAGDPTPPNLIIVTSVIPVTLFPTGAGASVIELSVQSSATSVAGVSLSGSVLTITPVASGTANITVRAVDTNGNAAEATFVATVAAVVPGFFSQPISQTVAVGSTVVFNASAPGATSFRWERNGMVIATATSAMLVIDNATSDQAGEYRVIATSSIGSTTSESAVLNVVATEARNVGRLVNLSILTSAGSGAKVLTMGAVIGAGDPVGGLPLVIRGVGPTLAQVPFSVSGVLLDPVMTFYSAGNGVPLETNDNWGGSPLVTAAFRSVAAFDLPSNSLDSAIVRPAPGVVPGGYTVQVTGKGDATGTVIAEIYDASGEARTANTPRLINLSMRGEVRANTDLAVGFVLGGQTARTVLVRGVGPSLAAFGISGLMADPLLELFNNATGVRIAANDDWAGNPAIAGVSVSVGAFSLAGADSKDAVLLVTLPPGPYSARISGVGGSGGTAVVEVYEVR